MPYTVSNLPFNPAKLDGLSEKMVVSHFVDVYCNTVKRLNVISEQLAKLDFAKTPSFLLNALKREELAAFNSVVLHEVYFDSLGGSSLPSGETLDAFVRHFGSFERWHVQFTALARSQATRAGWVVLAWSHRDHQLINLCGTEFSVSLVGATPVLALDMHEHAFQLDFGSKSSAYVDAFLKNVNWKAVTERLRAAVAASPRVEAAEPLMRADSTHPFPPESLQ